MLPSQTRNPAYGIWTNLLDDTRVYSEPTIGGAGTGPRRNSIQNLSDVPGSVEQTMWDVFFANTYTLHKFMYDRNNNARKNLSENKIINHVIEEIQTNQRRTHLLFELWEKHQDKLHQYLSEKMYLAVSEVAKSKGWSQNSEDSENLEYLAQ